MCQELLSSATTWMWGKLGVEVKPIESQDELYQRAAETYGAALVRMAHAYEADPDLRRDLTQEIHLALWRSFDKFNGRCSLRTWVYRVAHNVATSHIVHRARGRRNVQTFLTLEESGLHAGAEDVEATADRQ